MITRNYTEEQLALFKELYSSRVEDVKVFSKRRHKQYMEGIINKYSESAHFIYELLQNADDASASKVEIIVEPTFMIFKHNGKKHFTVTKVVDEEDENKVQGDINAITGTGFSTKDENGEENKIGKFGIGFKAVFQYSDEPYIYDEDYCFKLIDKIIPELLFEDHPLRKKNETLFYLPLKKEVNAYDKIVGRLSSLENPILFLHNLQEIHWKANGSKKASGKFIKTLESTFEDDVFFDIKCEKLCCSTGANNQKIWLFSRSITLSDNSSQSISVVYFLDKDGKLNTNIRPPLYCFFPLKIKFNFCFSGHAPFQLIDSRQNIKEDSEINILLQRELIKLAAEALVCLRNIGLSNSQFLIDENLSSILPDNPSMPTDGLVNDFCYFKQIVQEHDLILSVNKKYIPIDHAWYSESRELEDLLKKRRLNQLLNTDDTADFVAVGSNRKNINFELLQDYGLNILTPESFADMFDDDFIQQQDLEWANRFYNYLKNRGRQLWNKKEQKKNNQSSSLRNKKIIFTSTGEWIEPFEKYFNNINAYLPPKKISKKRSKYYNFVNDSLIEKHEVFFRELGLKEPDQIDYIKQEILSKYQDNSKLTNNNIFQSDFETIFQIYRQAGDDLKKNMRALLADEYQMLGYYSTDKDELNLFKIDELYDDTDEIKDYYGENVPIIDYDTYTNEESKLTKDVIRNFTIDLGLKSHISVVKTTNWYDFNYNLRCKQYNDVSSSRGSEEYISNCEDYLFETFTESWPPSIGHKQSLIMWDCLRNTPPSLLEKYKHSTCTGKRKYNTQYGVEKFTADSSLLFCLKTKKWIYNESGKENFKPSEITLEQFQSFGYGECSTLTKELGFKFDAKAFEKAKQEALMKEEKKKQADAEFLQAIDNSGLSRDEILEFARLKKEKKERLQRKFEPHPEENSTQEYNEKDFEDYQFDTPDENNTPSNANSKGFNNIRDYLEESIGKEDSWREDFKRRQEEEFAKEIERKNLRNSLNDVERYSKDWFLRRLELECLTANESANNKLARSLSITFSSVEPHLDNNVLIFKKPSGSIPIWLESIDNISITLHFSNHEDIKKPFTMASVKDYSLRIKAKKTDAKELSYLDWKKFTKADIEFNTPVDLISSLKTSFENLDFDLDYNLQQNLQNNIRFIFGPPGTGKTTYLSRKVISPRMASETESCKILVLTPTNKACDVIAKKLMEDNPQCGWLSRFVSTSDDSIEAEGYVCDRNSDIHSYNKCCVVSTTARLSFDFFKTGNGNLFLKDIEWDLIVFDEGSMINLAEIAFAIYKFNKKEIIIAGDPLQIPPVDAENIWDGENIYSMVHLNKFDNPKTFPIQFDITNLEKQWRSIEPIGELFSQYAYDAILQHNRKTSDQLALNIPQLPLKPITFVPFKVDDFDSLYSSKKLNNSNVHIYSALLAAEFAIFVAKKFATNNPTKEMSIGIICPYTPQAQIIQKLIEHSSLISNNISIVTGTVHSFQGGQCNMIITVMNPPKGLKNGAANAHINNKNIVNVSISRAMDYLCLLVPEKNCTGYSNLKEINKLGSIAQAKLKQHIEIWGAGKIEQIIYGKGANYLDTHTFITSHQLANVFSPTKFKYEIRIDDNSIDVQMGEYN